MGRGGAEAAAAADSDGGCSGGGSGGSGSGGAASGTSVLVTTSVVVACCDDDGCDDSCDDGCAGIEPAATAASCGRGTRFLRGAFAIVAAHARERCSHFASLGPSSCQSLFAFVRESPPSGQWSVQYFLCGGYSFGSQ